MMSFKPQYSSVKGISEKRRLPRLGKIRLGVKKIAAKSGKEYPAEVDYFVCPEEVRKVYGDQPKELDVLFPLNDIGVVFPQSYCWWGSARGVKCRGDGERASRATDDGFEEIDCPCEKLETKETDRCRFQAHLMCVLYRVSLGGVYQISLGSYHSTVDINSGLDYATALIGRFSMIPFKLRRVEKETHHEGQKQIHYTLVLTPDVDMSTLNELRGDTQRVLIGTQYILPAPESVNPELENGAIEVEAEQVESHAEAEPAQPASKEDDLNKITENAEFLELLNEIDLPAARKVALKKEYESDPPADRLKLLTWLRGCKGKPFESAAAAAIPDPEPTTGDPEKDLWEKRHKECEAKLAEAGIDREQFKQWLVSVGWLEPTNKGVLSLNNVSLEVFDELRGNWDSTFTGFADWQKAQAEGKLSV